MPFIGLMCSARVAFSLLVFVLLTFTGCGYVHLGRRPSVTPAIGDERLLRENSDLRLEKKMLQQELAIAHAQGTALRAALENRAADGATSKHIIAQLNESVRELARLRADYVRLETERAEAVAAGEEASLLKAKLHIAEETLAASLRAHTELQREVVRLRADVAKARDENSVLSAQVKAVTSGSDEAQAALAQLNTDLMARKEQRDRIDADAETSGAGLKELRTNEPILARQRLGAAEGAGSLFEPALNVAATRSGGPDGLGGNLAAPEADRAKVGKVASAIPVADTGSAAAPPAAVTVVKKAAPVRAASQPIVVAEASRIELGSAPAPAASGNEPVAASVPDHRDTTSLNATLVNLANVRTGAGRDSGERRTHVIASGDTLAKISSAYYGTPARWGDILSCNREVLGEENKLIIGRTLLIP